MKMPADGQLSAVDRRLLDACRRLARRHRGLTATNPSVGTLLVQFEDGVPVIVGRGITARGGRPHAESVAIAQAGARAAGSTTYVTLEPCAHHGATPPCAQALIDANVGRVVTAWTDPDDRVDGKGHAMLREAGIETIESDRQDAAAADLAAYITRKRNNRPHVTLKLAVSVDSKIGRQGEEVAITGTIARAYGHRMRAESDAILVGRGTVEADDPDLTCRLPGLEDRSPHRFVMDGNASLPANSRLAQRARKVPVTLVSAVPSLPESLSALGVRLMAAERPDGRLALPEMLEDMAALGISSLLVEGGAEIAQSFLEAGLVDRIALFQSPVVVDSDGIASPLTADTIPAGFIAEPTLTLGEDRLTVFNRS